MLWWKHYYSNKYKFLALICQTFLIGKHLRIMISYDLFSFTPTTEPANLKNIFQPSTGWK